MNLILDTNIVLSALFKPQSTPAALIALWREKRFGWLTCREQVLELVSVLSRPKIAARIQAGNLQSQELLSLMDTYCEFFALAAPYPAVCRDAQDDYLLALLVQSKAAYLVTGDKDLLVLRPQFSILTPAELRTRL